MSAGGAGPGRAASVRIVPATERDVPLVLELIRALAEYERLGHEVVATEAVLRETLFGPRPGAEVVLAYVDDAEGAGGVARGEAAGFALFFHNYSTFLGRPGLALEDLFVRPAWRGRGVGRRLLAHLAALAVERRCGRFEWQVLDWNEDAIRVYRGVGAVPMSDWTTYRLTGEALRQLAEEAKPSRGEEREQLSVQPRAVGDEC